MNEGIRKQPNSSQLQGCLAGTGKCPGPGAVGVVEGRDSSSFAAPTYPRSPPVRLSPGPWGLRCPEPREWQWPGPGCGESRQGTVKVLTWDRGVLCLLKALNCSAVPQSRLKSSQLIPALSAARSGLCRKTSYNR